MNQPLAAPVAAAQRRIGNSFIRFQIYAHILQQNTVIWTERMANHCKMVSRILLRRLNDKCVTWYNAEMNGDGWVGSGSCVCGWNGRPGIAWQYGNYFTEKIPRHMTFLSLPHWVTHSLVSFEPKILFLPLHFFRVFSACILSFSSFNALRCWMLLALKIYRTFFIIWHFNNA